MDLLGRAPHPWTGMRACLTSKHGKLHSIREPVLRLLGLEVFEDSSIDTDLLGTFSGEVERPGPPREVVIRKARLGAEKTGTRLGLATEGSFGPHPQMPWVASHLELLACVDLQTGVSIVESVQTEDTNFAHFEAESWHDIESFLARARFPSHALMVRTAGTPLVGSAVFKGITDLPALQRAFEKCKPRSPLGRVQLETDMRAHVNPTRQKVIRAAAEKLALRLQCLCPQCDYPGYGILRYERGLECESCGAPGPWVKSIVRGCGACDRQESGPREDGRTRLPQSACPSCEDRGE